MKRDYFVQVVEEALDSLPQEFRSRIQNVAILVEDFPPDQSPSQPGQPQRLLLGIFHGVPATKVQHISCFTKRTSKPSVRARPKSASKSSKRSCTNWDTISA